MRIIHTVPSIAEASSGPSYSVVRLVEELRRGGVDAVLASLDSPGHREMPGWNVRFPRLPFDRRIGASPAMHRWLRQAAAAAPAPLLHNHSLWMMPNVYPGWVAKSSGVPLVVSPRGTLGKAAFEGGSALKKLLWPLLQRPALDAVSCFHATAESEAAEIRGHGFGQPIAVIPNGIDVPTSARRQAERRREVLFLGRIHPKKGLDVLLRAWQRIEPRRPGWTLRIVGPDNGGHLARIVELARELRLQSVDFAGELVGEEKAEAYARASLFVLPTRNENFAMTVAEALASGTPAIVSKGAPWSGLDRTASGWWIDFGEEPLARTMEAAMSTSPDELARMGERGIAWMRDDFSWHAIGQRMAAVYRWVLAGMPAGERPPSVIPQGQ
jgi:glycosyltransferase involved in cell wall biosynthesis